VPEEVRRRRIIRKLTVPVATIAAAATAATGVEIMVELPDPASPTRTMPVLVTGGSVADADDDIPAMAAAEVDDMPMPAAGVDAAGDVGFIPPVIEPEPVLPVEECPDPEYPDDPEPLDDDEVLCIAAGVVAVPPPEPDEVPATVITTEGLPAPHFAETVYWPALVPAAIVAVPVKLIEPWVIDAWPPLNAAE
jgi:hypothetical protein